MKQGTQMRVVPDLVKSAVHVPGENEQPSTWHTHMSAPPSGDPLMYGRDDCIPWSHGDMERGWEKGTAPIKLPKEPRITERHFILPSDYNWATRDINLLTVVLSEFQPFEELRNLSLK